MKNDAKKSHADGCSDNRQEQIPWKRRTQPEMPLLAPMSAILFHPLVFSQDFSIF